MFPSLSTWCSCFGCNWTQWWWNQNEPNQTTAKILSDSGILWIYNIIICYPVIQSICDKKYLFRKFIIIIEWFSKPPISQLEQSVVHWIGSLVACWLARLVGWLVSGAAWAKFTKCKYRMQWNRFAENSWNSVQRLHLRLTISSKTRNTSAVVQIFSSKTHRDKKNVAIPELQNYSYQFFPRSKRLNTLNSTVFTLLNSES